MRVLIRGPQTRPRDGRDALPKRLLVCLCWWLFPLTLLMPWPGASQTSLRLAPYFQDNMVLQRSANTLIYGTGPPGKSVYVRLKSAAGGNLGPTWKRKIEPSGLWRMTLDLSLPVFASKPPVALWVSEDGKSRLSFQKTNVALGDVWLVAGWENEGVPATPGELDDTVEKQMVRFSGAGPTQTPGGSESAGTQGWDPWPKEAQFSRFPSLHLRLAHLLARGEVAGLAQAGYVGIVCARLQDLESGLAPEAASAQAGEVLLPKQWTWVQQKVAEAQTNRWDRLIRSKHQGIVTNEPAIIDYDAPVAFPYAAFSPQAPPASLFSFKGAIWPRRPQNMAR